MQIPISTYIPGNSPVHTCDARVKLILLAVYVVSLFLVETWWALVMCLLIFLALLCISKVAPRRVFLLSAPLMFIALIALVANAFSFNIEEATTASLTGLGAVSTGLFAEAPPIALIGSFGFVPAGFARGCFYALRIILLVTASLLISFTTTSTQLTQAFSSFLRPLRSFKLPVDDIASVLSIALRFIPLVAEELGQIHDAQWSRGAQFSQGGLFARLKAWAVVLLPLFVGMFRRAEALACAMDARCYGIPGTKRSSLNRQALGVSDVFTLVLGLALLISLAALG